MLTRSERLQARKAIHDIKVNASILSFTETIEQEESYRTIVGDTSTQKIEKGKPCLESRSSDKRKTLRSKAIQMISTLTSKKVPLSVVEMRTSKCRECLHCTKIGEKLFCECCSCPKWAIADCRVKNKYQKHFCPTGYFGVYKE